MKNNLCWKTSKIFFAFLLLANIHPIYAQWAETGAGTSPLNANGAIRVVHNTHSGLLLAGGNFRTDSNYTYVAIWNDTTWKELGGDNSLKGNNSIYTIASDTSGNIYVAGAITEGGDYVIGHWNGSVWSILGNVGFNGYIADMVTDKAGNLYIAGGFKNSSNEFYVAKWNGTTFSEVGIGANALNPNGELEALAVDHLGNLYVTGFFTNSNGKYYVAKWDGNSWAEIGNLNANNYINDVVSDPAGNIYAAGGFMNANSKYYVAKWNGTAWSEAGALNGNNFVFDLATDVAGNIYAAGSFTNSNNFSFVAKWNGTSWSELGAPNSLNPNDDIETMAADASGNLYCAGYFTNTDTLNYVAKYTPNISNVDEIEAHDFLVYPNPFTYQLNISSLHITSPNSLIEVLDVQGRKVCAQQLNTTLMSIQTENWRSGFYFLKVYSLEKSLFKTYRLIKSN